MSFGALPLPLKKPFANSVPVFGLASLVVAVVVYNFSVLNLLLFSHRTVIPIKQLPPTRWLP